MTTPLREKISEVLWGIPNLKGVGEIELKLESLYREELNGIEKRLLEGLEFQTWKIPDGADIYEVRTHLRHWLQQELTNLST